MNWSTKSQYSTERGQSLLPLAAFRSRQWNPFQADHHNGEATRWLDGINALSRNRYLPLRSFFLTELAVTLIHHDHTGTTATVLLLMHKHGAKVLKNPFASPIFNLFFLLTRSKSMLMFFYQWLIVEVRCHFFFDSQNLYSDDFEAKTSENMRYFKDFFFGDTTLFL